MTSEAKIIFTSVFVVVLFAIASSALIKLRAQSIIVREGGGSYACTMDAKMCPDGSYVGRVPPYCQFAACPDSN